LKKERIPINKKSGGPVMERGIVKEIIGSRAFVEFKSSEGCASCSTKIICSPSAGQTRRVAAVNYLGANIGDTVDVDESERSEIRMAFLQYGIPLMGFVGTIGAANFIPAEIIAAVGVAKELVWFGLGVIGLFAGGYLANRYAWWLAAKGVPAFRIIQIL
jgi:positive regulator of sigma E activity